MAILLQNCMEHLRHFNIKLSAWFVLAQASAVVAVVSSVGNKLIGGKSIIKVIY